MSDPSPDPLLLEAWRQGDASAGERLMARHYDRVWRFFEIKVPSVAQDLTQQTFLACVEGRDRVEQGASFRAYLFGIARRMLMQYLRRSERFDRVQRFASAQSPQTMTTASRLVARRQEQRLLMRALDNLPVDQQIAVQLHYWEGLRPQEIAQVQGISPSTVSSRLMRARDQIRQFLERISRRPQVLASLLADLDGWTRSLAGGEPPATRPPKE